MQLRAVHTLCLDLIVAPCRRLRLAGRRLMIFVKVIPFEKLLSRRILQVNFILFHGLCILPLLVIYMILVEILIVGIWQIRGQHPTFVEGIPLEVLEPRMCLDFVISIETQSAGGFSSETLKEIGQNLMEGRILTLLMKSAASRLQPAGPSFFLIWAWDSGMFDTDTIICTHSTSDHIVTTIEPIN